MFARLRGDRHLLGDGHHPAPQRGRHGQGDRQPRVPPGQHRQARRRPVPGARPLQRAGRPHDGHLGAGARPLPRRAARRVRLRAAPRARLRHRRRGQGAARRRRQGLLRAWAATSSPPSPTPTVTEEAMRRRRAHRPRLHQAQPLPRRPRPRGADPARARPQREGPHRRPRAAGHRRGLDVRGPRLAGSARAGLAAPALRGRHRLLAGAGHARRPTTSCRGRRCAPTTPRSGAGSPASCRAARRTTRRSTSPAASCCRTRRATPAPSRPTSGEAIFTRQPDRGAPGARGPAAAPDDALARPVQHHDLRPRRPLPRRSRAAAAWSSCTPTTSPPSASPTGDLVDLVSEWEDGSSGRRRRSAWSPTTSRAAARRRTTPRPTRWSPLDSHGRGQQPPGVQVGRSSASSRRRQGAGGRPASTAAARRTRPRPPAGSDSQTSPASREQLAG